MSVTGEFRIDIRPYTGYPDPAMPIGAYIAQGGLVGDASGGGVFFIFQFQRTDDNQVSELFSLEQVNFDNTGSGDTEGVMQTIAMDSLAHNRPVSDQKWHLQLSGARSVSTPELLQGTVLPIWLGSPNRVEGDGVLRFEFTNVDLILFAVTIQGYIWGPRSVLASGGPRRPVGGLFGRG